MIKLSAKNRKYIHEWMGNLQAIIPSYSKRAWIKTDMNKTIKIYQDILDNPDNVILYVSHPMQHIRYM